VRVSGETEQKLEKKAKKKARLEEEAAEKLAEGVDKVKIEASEEEKKMSDLEKEKKAIVEKQYEDEGCEYFIATKAGQVEDVIEGLINLADRLLRIGGRLVFLFPVDKSK